MKRVSIFLIIALISASLMAHDYLPAVDQSNAILLTGGDIHTGNGTVLVGTDILFENGKIVMIEQSISAPTGCEVIDVTGKKIYPGMIGAVTTLGLTEIGAVRATNDTRERGRNTPEVKAFTAYNPDSELLPTVRANGITTVQVAPGGSLLRGRSSILHLDGWTVEDAGVKLIDGLHMNWPSVGIRTGWWESRSAEEQRKDMAKNRESLKDIFDRARAYHIVKKADPKTKTDIRLEAMEPLFTGELPLYIAASDYRQIDEAVAFCKEMGLRMILVGGREAWKCTDLLKENNVPVIFSTVLTLPQRSDYAYDTPFKVPAILAEAGVKFCLGAFGSWGARNLPFQAGQAVGYGLDPNEALRSVTLSVAEILGIDDNYGSLEVGKSATLIVSEGDLLDYIGHRVTAMYIDGKTIDLNSKQKELFKKYRAKKWQPADGHRGGEQERARARHRPRVRRRHRRRGSGAVRRRTLHRAGQLALALVARRVVVQGRRLHRDRLLRAVHPSRQRRRRQHRRGASGRDAQVPRHEGQRRLGVRHRKPPAAAREVRRRAGRARRLRTQSELPDRATDDGRLPHDATHRRAGDDPRRRRERQPQRQHRQRRQLVAPRRGLGRALRRAAAAQAARAARGRPLHGVRGGRPVGSHARDPRRGDDRRRLRRSRGNGRRTGHHPRSPGSRRRASRPGPPRIHLPVRATRRAAPRRHPHAG